MKHNTRIGIVFILLALAVMWIAAFGFHLLVERGQDAFPWWGLPYKITALVPVMIFAAAGLARLNRD